MAELGDGKRLTELRVIDLKTELERRGLEKTGNKAILLERLSKAISSEGFNPDEYLIYPSVGNRISKTSNSDGSKIMSEDGMDSNSQPEDLTQECNSVDESETLVESEPPVDENNEVDVEPILADAKTEEFVTEEPDGQYQEEEMQEQMDDERQYEDVEQIDHVENENTELVENEDNYENVEQMDDEMQYENAVGNHDDLDNFEKKAENEEIAAEEGLTNDSAKAEHNGIDTEDSINLTIGEDEALLFPEEVDSNDKSKDAGEKKKKEESSGVAVSDRSKSDSKGSNSVKKEDSSSTASPVQGSGGQANKEGGKDNGKDKDKDKDKDSSTGQKSSEGHSDGSKSGDQSNRSQKKDKDDKDKKSQSSANASSRNLWVSGLSSTTRATDLKQIFSKYGKVVGAKVVTNARTPGARCYGYVTMSTSDDAARCIQHLHRTELHGRVISVEKAKGDSTANPRKREPSSKSDGKDSSKKPSESSGQDDKSKKDGEKDGKTEETAKDKVEKIDDSKRSRESSQDNKDGSVKDSDNRSTKSSSRKSESIKKDDKSKRSWDARAHTSRSKSRERQRKENVLSFAKIKEERERNRVKERERMMREEKRRRQEEMQRAREIERRHREEAARLEREREKLRMERERIEQEKAELLRMERERQKLEREKIERERMELKRRQMRVEESSRRAPPPPSLKRGAGDPRRDHGDGYEPERKRMATASGLRRHSGDTDRRGGGAPRMAVRSERYEASSRPPPKAFSRGGGRPAHYEESRGPRDHGNPTMHSSNPRAMKESRGYERPPPSYGREVPRNAPPTKNPREERYTSSKPIPSSRDSRYADNGRTTGWHSGPPPPPPPPPSTKSYHSVNSGRSDQSNWGRSDNRWANSNSMSSGNVRHPGPQSYHQSSQMQSVAISNANSRSYNTYDPYKQMQSVRKY